MEPVRFSPSVSLDPRLIPRDVTIKGSTPRLRYPFRLIDLYPVTPALGVVDAYERVRSILDGLDRLLCNRLNLRASFRLPEHPDQGQASALLAALFDPRRPSLSAPARRDGLPTKPGEIFGLSVARPFPLARASSDKVLHTLAWIDTNVKVIAERIGRTSAIPSRDVKQLVEAALKIYSLLVKMEDFRLASRINFNHSMFLQDRILNLIFGDALFFGAVLGNDATEPSRLKADGNRIALDLLKTLGELSYRELLELSVFMGVVWTSRRELRRTFADSPNRTLISVQDDLQRARTRFCIDSIDSFLKWCGRDLDSTIAVILDDNGESVFDLALFQRLLGDTGHLKAVFLVNRFPVSNNISLGALEALFADEYFVRLGRFMEQGRVSLAVEDQVFRSFEHDYLSAETRGCLSDADIAYVKGVNFFETFQPDHMVRYYCFTVSGFTSMMLTGCSEGSGVFARVDKGHFGYEYTSPEVMRPLLELVGPERTVPS